MNLKQAKAAAWIAAHEAVRQVEAMQQSEPNVSVESAKTLVRITSALACAAREIESRLLGVDEPKNG